MATMKPLFFPCHSDSDCPANEQCYRAGTADAECIKGLGTPKRCTSTADCSGGRECYTTMHGYSICIFMATMKPRFYTCHSDSDCPANEQCYRAGTADAECIKGLGTPKRCTSTADCSGGRECYT